MRDRPDAPTLLRAVARFLDKDVRSALTLEPKAPAREPQALAFRALVAGHLAGLVASELEAAPRLDRLELEGLRALLPHFEPAPEEAPSEGDPRRLHRAYVRELADQIRDGGFDREGLARVRAHVLATLREELAVTNPRFDPSANVP
jgi:hypothetical protein